jgi:hypothetical protein
MTMDIRCLCGKAELVEPEPWDWAEGIGRVLVFMEHLVQGEHEPVEIDSALARLRDLLEGWRARALLSERGYQVTPYERGGHLGPKVTRAENRTGKDEQVVPVRGPIYGVEDLHREVDRVVDEDDEEER